MPEIDPQNYHGPALDRMPEFAMRTRSSEQQEIVDFFSNGARGRLPERLFRENFLAFFCRETPLQDYAIYASKWIEIAGSQSAEVDLINDLGQTVITIPPFHNTKVDYKKLDLNFDTSFLAAISRLDTESTNNRAVALAQFNNTIQNKIKNNQLPSVDRYIQEKWIAVYNYFGRPDLAKIIQKELANAGFSSGNNGGFSGNAVGGMEMEFD